MRVHPSAFPLKTKKIMKKSLFMAAVLLLSLCMFTFSACDDNEEDKNVGNPDVALNEVGEENSKTAIAGSDLHLEGEITAENRISVSTSKSIRKRAASSASKSRLPKESTSE